MRVDEMKVEGWEKEWVKKWLIHCDEKDIYPWEWDFKQCYVSKEEYDRNTAIANILKYKNFEFISGKEEFNITGEAGKNADCDKEAFPMYALLGWQKKPEDIIRGDAMNSYKTTFTTAMTRAKRSDSRYKDICDAIGIDLNKKLWNQAETLYDENNYRAFDWIAENEEGFSRFAKLTHTIGNFTVLPHWMNTGRASLGDYWDLALKSLYDFLNPINAGAWIGLIEKYKLQVFVNNNYEVEEFWKGHFSKGSKPSTSKEVGQFLRCVNLSITERGKHMVKALCDSLGETSYGFYEELKNLKEPKFANELWVEEKSGNCTEV